MFDFEKLEKVFADKDFTEAFAKLETVKDAVAALVEKGIDVTEEEFEKVVKLVKAAKENAGELTDDVLEGIAGGVDLSKLLEMTKYDVFKNMQPNFIQHFNKDFDL